MPKKIYFAVSEVDDGTQSKKKLSENNNFKIHISQKINRSSHPNVYYKKCALKNFAKFSGKHQRLSFCFNKVAGLRPTTLLA